MNSYPADNIIRISVQFTDLITGDPVDPTDVLVAVRDPLQVVTEYTYTDNQVIRDGTGAYHYDVSAILAGYYTYIWQGSGDILATQANQFQVTPLPFVP